MITKAKIKDIATYKYIEVEPKQINYIYGGNGTGKTTLSRFLSNSENLVNGNISCSEDVEVIAYNKDFVDKNFCDNNAIKGIFTIGEDSKEIEEQIQKNIEQKLKYDEVKENKNKSIDKLTSEANEEKLNFEEKCWLVKKNNEHFQECFKGYMGSKETFAKHCLDLFDKKNNLEISSYVNDYNILFCDELKYYEEFSLIDLQKIKSLEDNKILKTAIVCVNNNSFSELISNIKNSDWVRNGMEYIKDGNICPFCQQTINKQIKSSLMEVFDKTYENQINELKKVASDYEKEINEVSSYVSEILKNPIEIIDKSNLVLLHNELNTLIPQNISKLKAKENSPSDIVNLHSLKDTLLKINEEIIHFNQSIKNNNNIIANKETQKKILKNNVWNTIVNNLLYDTIVLHKKKIEGINQGVFKLKGEVINIEQKILELQLEINQLQSKTSTIDNAINEINNTLTSFSFTGFRLEKADDNRNYKIVRPDGSDVRETLSEGEQRFITFLYFYQLIKGNIEAKKSLKSKVVIIDDPISSLDSNILFIVSTLVKKIIEDCLSDKDLIKQVFVLTHNIYFHQEIAFKGARKNISTKRECFWTIRKKDNISDIEISSQNSIKTSYELLWEDVKDPSKSSSVTVFNTLRRILEYYFNIIGKTDYEKCIDDMEGEDKILCKSLLSFININSHTISDDFVIIYDDDTISKYIKVFEKIFEITGHKAHYDMMMRKNED